jgi:hypothetical protein
LGYADLSMVCTIYIGDVFVFSYVNFVRFSIYIDLGNSNYIIY